MDCIWEFGACCIPWIMQHHKTEMLLMLIKLCLQPDAAADTGTCTPLRSIAAGRYSILSQYSPKRASKCSWIHVIAIYALAPMQMQIQRSAIRRWMWLLLLNTQLMLCCLASLFISLYRLWTVDIDCILQHWKAQRSYVRQRTRLYNLCVCLFVSRTTQKAVDGLRYNFLCECRR